MSTELVLSLWKKTKKLALVACAIIAVRQWCVCGVTTQRRERRMLGQDVDALVEDAQMVVLKYWQVETVKIRGNMSCELRGCR